MKTLSIIGCGIAGVSAGIGSLKKGYDVTIYEKNKNTGGCCTGWIKDGMYIDNCMHWLCGANHYTKLFKLWKKYGAMDETSNMYQPLYFYKSITNGYIIELSSNLDDVLANLLLISSKDEKEIKRFINVVKKVTKVINNTSLLKDKLYKLSLLKDYLYYHNMSLEEYSKKYHSTALQTLFTDYFPKNYSTLAFIVSYATYASGNGKVYMDGSYKFFLNMLNKYLMLGGKVVVNKEITSINVIDNKVQSISSGDEVIKSDAYIYSGDYYHLYNKLLNNTTMPKEISNKFYDDKDVFSSFHIAFKVLKKENKIKDTTIIDINPTDIGIRRINRLVLRSNTYLYQVNDFEVLQSFIILYNDDIEYILSRNEVEYNNLKENIVNSIKKELVNLYDFSYMEVLDSWSPKTYKDFLNLYKGSYLGFIFKKKDKLPSNINHMRNNKLSNMIITSPYLRHTGGLPISLENGHIASKLLR